MLKSPITGGFLWNIYAGNTHNWWSKTKAFQRRFYHQLSELLQESLCCSSKSNPWRTKTDDSKPIEYYWACHWCSLATKVPNHWSFCLDDAAAPEPPPSFLWALCAMLWQIIGKSSAFSDGLDDLDDSWVHGDRNFGRASAQPAPPEMVAKNWWLGVAPVVGALPFSYTWHLQDGHRRAEYHFDILVLTLVNQPMVKVVDTGL